MVISCALPMHATGAGWGQDGGQRGVGAGARCNPEPCTRHRFPVQPHSHGHSGAVMLRAVMLTAALLQQSLARAPWCCGAPWAPAWRGVTAMLTVPGPRSAAPPAAATSANCPPRVKALCCGAEIVPRSHAVPSLAEYRACTASAPLSWSTVPLWGLMGAWGGGSSHVQGLTTPFPLSARAQCARDSVLPHLPGLVSALSYAWRTRTVHPARSAACRTAAVRVFPHCRVRPTPHPARKGRHGVGHPSCSDHRIHLFQAQPSPGWGGCTGSCQFGAIPPHCHRSTHCPTAPTPRAAPPAEGASTV